MKIKHLVFIFIAVVYPMAFAQAAKQVSGTVPDIQPVQPAPEGISPNVSKNIQFQDPSHEGQFDAEGNVINGSQSQQATEQQPSFSTSVLPEKIAAAGSGWWKYALIVLLLLGGGAVYWKVNRKKD